MKIRKKAYLMIDITVGTAIVSIFLSVIALIFSEYLNLKKSMDIESNLYYAIIKELDRNLSYYNLSNLNEGQYSIEINTLEEIKEKEILDKIKKKERVEDCDYILNIKNITSKFVEYDIVNNDDSVGFIEYRR